MYLLILAFQFLFLLSVMLHISKHLLQKSIIEPKIILLMINFYSIFHSWHLAPLYHEKSNGIISISPNPSTIITKNLYQINFSIFYCYLIKMDSKNAPVIDLMMVIDKNILPMSLMNNSSINHRLNWNMAPFTLCFLTREHCSKVS